MSFTFACIGRRWSWVLVFFLVAASAEAAGDARARVRGLLEAERQRIEALADGAFSRLPVPADAIDVVKNFGVPNDGKSGAAVAINRAIRAADGHALFFPPGVYLLEDSIRPVSGTKLYFSPQAELRRGFEGGNGDAKGSLLQGARDFSASDVTVVGGVWTNPDHAHVGRAITIIGNNWLVDSVRVTSWGPARGPSSCINVAGDDITVRNCVLTGCTGQLNQDGIRVMCGRHIRLADCYVESGDDCFCAFPTETVHVALSGRDLADVRFERCYGISATARFLACGETALGVIMKKVAMTDLNAVQVRGIAFADCTGMSLASVAHAPAFFVVSADTNPAAGVTDIQFSGCIGVGGPAGDQGALLHATPGARCTQITLSKCEIYGGQKETLTITRACSQVRVIDCKLDGVTTNLTR